jgi:hypothetical protein
MSADQGPYLYDDDPAPLHTGTPRAARGLILGVLGGTVLVAIAMAFGLPLVKGSGEEQSREVAGVFLAALAEDDLATAHPLLCAAERTAVPPEAVTEVYGGGQDGEVVGVTEDELDGESVQLVEVRWADGSGSTLTVVNENGARVCGING